MDNPDGGRLGNVFGRMAAEFLVIVVGVLVALAVDGYASAREDRARVATHLAQLEVELDDMGEQLSTERERYVRAEQAAGRVIEGLTNPSSADSDSLSAVFPAVFVGIGWEPEATVINTMIASGDIALVDDRQLQSELTRFRERTRAAAYRRDLAEELFMDGYRAMTQSADMLRWAPGVFGVSATGQRWDWGDLADDLHFRNGIYGIANGIRNHRVALTQLARHIEGLESSLDQSRAVE